MHITLIGMSNIGKSHWARRLAEFGFLHADCDELIERKLGSELTRAGFKGTGGMARWMGQPYDPQYPETSRKYIASERAVMQDVIGRLETVPAGRPLAVDTSGSVIYAGDDILERLRSLTKVIYFEASRAHVADLFARYATDPKPLIWDEAYVPRPGESPEGAIARSYPELLEDRARRYARMAHVTIPFELHRKPDADVALLMRYTKDY